MENKPITAKEENLMLKMGTKAQVLWTNVAKKAKLLIEESENNLIIQKANGSNNNPKGVSAGAQCPYPNHPRQRDTVAMRYAGRMPSDRVSAR